jgi:hypothetical protein
MEAPKRKPLGTRPRASRRKVKVDEVKVDEVKEKEVKANEVNVNEVKVEDANIRKEVKSVLDGLVYLTESVAKLEGIPDKKASRPKASRRKVKMDEVKANGVNVEDKKASRPKASRPKASRRKVKADEVKPMNVEDKKIRNEVSYVLDSLVSLTASLAKLERRPRAKSANHVTRPKLNGPKNFTSKIKKQKAVRRSRSRKSESNVRKGIAI